MTPVSKIVCMGDSITWGYPYGPDYSWVGLTAGETTVPLVNRGINGESSQELLDRFDYDVHPSKTGYIKMSAVFKEFCRNSLGIAGF